MTILDDVAKAICCPGGCKFGINGMCPQASSSRGGSFDIARAALEAVAKWLDGEAGAGTTWTTCCDAGPAALRRCAEILRKGA